MVFHYEEYAHFSMLKKSSTYITKYIGKSVDFFHRNLNLSLAKNYRNLYNLYYDLGPNQEVLKKLFELEHTLCKKIRQMSLFLSYLQYKLPLS